VFVLRSDFEDSGLHEAGAAEGCAAQAQRERAWIREDVSYEVNEPDAYALEEALRQKKSIREKWW
jgi:hypothetical protein